jgi:hypothetical protein
MRSAPGIVYRIILKDADNRFHNVQRARAFLQKFPTLLRGKAAAVDVVVNFVVGDFSRATVNDERGGRHEAIINEQGGNEQ